MIKKREKKKEKRKKKEAMSTSTTTITTEFFCKGNGVMALPTYAIDKLFGLFQVSSLPSDDLQQPIIDAKVDPAVMTQEYKADVPSLTVVPTLEALWPDIAITRVEEQEKLSIALKTTFNGQWKMQFERSTLEFYNRDGTTLDVPSMAIYSPENTLMVSRCLTALNTETVSSCQCFTTTGQRWNSSNQKTILILKSSSKKS